LLAATECCTFASFSHLAPTPACVTLPEHTRTLRTCPPLVPYCRAVLAGSSVLEAYSLRVAFQAIQRSAEEQGMGLWQYIKRGRDPTTVGAWRRAAQGWAVGPWGQVAV
jgi:hypothetical protein